MKKSRMVMKFDPYDTLMINCGNRILIVFHLYCCSKHELSTMLIVIRDWSKSIGEGGPEQKGGGS